MYFSITGEDAYTRPMRIYPALHYTMGGLWVDYNLQTTIPGLFALGECNFSDHGANRLGASALMQGLADGYFVIPYTLGNYLSEIPLSEAGNTDTETSAFREAETEVKDRTARLLDIQGKKTGRSFHKALGKVMWEYAGMARNAEGLKTGLQKVRELREDFWENVFVPGSGSELNIELERAGRVADFLEFAELLIHDALDRDESCGGHFREEHQTEEGEAIRNDEKFCNVSVWEHTGVDNPPKKHVEPLEFENVKLTVRSYK